MDTATLKPVKEFPVQHLHQYRHGLLDFNDVAEIGLSFVGKTMFMSVRDIQSNIWMAERKAATAPGR